MIHAAGRGLIDYLVDPMTGAALRLEITREEQGKIVEGSLYSASGTRYPIVRGIPRFVPTVATEGKSFGYQWHRWPTIQYESKNKGLPMEGHTRSMWERITAQYGSLDGQVVADFGCGSGRFVEVARSKGAKVIALDLSDSVEVVAEQFANDPDVLVVQGSVLSPPLRPRSLDGAFSIGVLHHTPSPSLGSQRVAESVKPGGWVSVCVYGKGGYYDFPSVSLYRRIFKALWPVLGPKPALAYSHFAVGVVWPFRRVPVVRRALKLVFPSITLPDWNWSVLDTFDSVTPTYQSAHESFEVFKWLKDAHVTSIEPSDWGFTAFHGTIPAER